MKTIKLPYKCDNYNLIREIIRQQTIVKKWSYNRFIDGKNEKEIRSLSKDLKNINDIDSWFIQSSIYDGKQIFKTKKEKVIFNKSLFYRRLKGLITKEEFINLKNDYLVSIGEKLQGGNRKFDFNFNENYLVFKPDRNNRIKIELPKLRNNLKKELNLLDEQTGLNGLPIMIKMDLNHIYLTFDETFLHKEKHILKQNRVMGIDLNPNHIGVSILDFNGDKYEIIETISFEIGELTGKKGNHNKLKHETINIVKEINKLCIHHQVGVVSIEDLNIKSGDLGSGKNRNSLILNKWVRNLFTEQLTKRNNISGINTIKILPYYTSYIGNLQHNYFDPVSSSIEIGRRGYEVVILKNKKFYPDLFIKDELLDQWKEHINSLNGWKDLFLVIKNLKLRYRVSLDSNEFDVFRINSKKSKTFKYVF